MQGKLESSRPALLLLTDVTSKISRYCPKSYHLFCLVLDDFVNTIYCSACYALFASCTRNLKESYDAFVSCLAVIAALEP